nr:hypothetical protein [Largemouth bass reovirus]
MINSTSSTVSVISPSSSVSEILTSVTDAAIVLGVLLIISVVWAIITAVLKKCGITPHPLIGAGINGLISRLARADTSTEMQMPTHGSCQRPGPKTGPTTATTPRPRLNSLNLEDGLSLTSASSEPREEPTTRV